MVRGQPRPALALLGSPDGLYQANKVPGIMNMASATGVTRRDSRPRNAVLSSQALLIDSLAMRSASKG